MKIWSITGAAIVVLLLSSCGLLTDPTADGSWQWFSVGAKRSEFGGVRLTQDGTLVYFANGAGNSRFDPALNDWSDIETPGGLGAVYDIARDGTEFVTSYGIYTRASPTSAWTLLEGSRALQLKYLGLDRDGNLYATTNSSVAPGKVYVKLKGSSAWTPVSGLPTSFLSAQSGVDPIGRAYLYTTSGLAFEFQGSSAVALPLPQAMTYDFAGNRYVSIGTAIQKVTPSGTLEPWVNFGGAGTAVVPNLIGFGKDGRFYGIAGDNFTPGIGFQKGDIVAVSLSDPKWTKVASGVVDGAGNRTAPPLTTTGYNVRFAPDGSLYFYGCESGCNPSGNAFSYGIYRLKF